MDIGGRILQFFQTICRFNFGDFEKEEFKKFLRMGLIFSLIIGVYWTLRPLKDSIFIQLVDRMQLPFAKTVSVLGFFPLLMLYTRLLQRTTREKMMLIFSAFYGVAILCFAALMFFVQKGASNMAELSLIPFIATKALGYIWYFFVESFGSLFPALFWAFASDTTDPTSAKRGFAFVYTMGQIGGVLFPYNIAGLPFRLGLKSDALSMFILGFLVLLIIPLFRYFLRSTPAHLLASFQGKNEPAHEKKEEAGFFEGLKLLLQHRYLIAMFGVNFIYEVIVTIFDFNFKIAASSQYSGVALSNYLSLYASSVNTVSLLCLLLGISNVTRYLGVGTALAAMPLIVGAALFGFLSLDSLSFMFALMVGSKAINYALNGPALKQLYIPTSPDARFKAQAWIETFGNRTAKEAGSVFNMLLAPLQSLCGPLAGRAYYLMLSGALGFPLLALWLIVALYLGRTYRGAIEAKRVVC